MIQNKQALERILEHAKNLIGFKSLSPRSAGAVEYVAEFLRANGFETEIKVFGNLDSLVTNLYAIYGNNSGLNICFAGHVDVVPEGYLQDWDSDPYVADIRHQKLYGRGAVDMKGAIACALVAVTDFIKHNQNLKHRISFLLTSDEEKDAKHGTLEMIQYLDQKGCKIDFVILGEPTSVNVIGDTVKIGRRGSINFNLQMNGKQGHVAYATKAVNPIYALIDVLRELKLKFKDLDINGVESFETDANNNLEITSINVDNTATNIIPGHARSAFNVRFNALYTAEDIVQIVQKALNNCSLQYSLSYNVSAHPFVQQKCQYFDIFTSSIKDVLDIEPAFSINGGTSDARFIKNYCSVLEFGLLNATAHQANEHVEIKDLQKLYNVYYFGLHKLCSMI